MTKTMKILKINKSNILFFFTDNTQHLEMFAISQAYM